MTSRNENKIRNLAYLRTHPNMLSLIDECLEKSLLIINRHWFITTQWFQYHREIHLLDSIYVLSDHSFFVACKIKNPSFLFRSFFPFRSPRSTPIATSIRCYKTNRRNVQCAWAWATKIDLMCRRGRQNTSASIELPVRSFPRFWLFYSHFCSLVCSCVMTTPCT